MNSARGKVFGVAMLAGALALSVTSLECASGSTTKSGTGGKTAAGSGGSSVGAGGGASVGTGGSATGAGGMTGTGGAITGTGGSTSGSGGTTGMGGAVSGTGGATMLTCASPAMIGTSGLLTDFSSTYWSNTTGKWGMAPVIGGKFSYAGPAAVDGAAMSTATATVDTAAQNLQFTATVEPAGYAGVGLSFDECATVGTFNAVQFTLLGTTGGCALEVQVQTYDEKPTTQSPAGGCTANCSYRAKTNLALPTSDTDKTTVTVGLNATDLPGWTDIEAAQIVGLQWQVTVPAPVDGGSQTACTVDMRIDDVTFLMQ